MKAVKPNRPSPRPGAHERALRRYGKRYKALKVKLQALGYICRGSIARSWLTCGKPTCACHREPAQRHGPYTYWTRKVGGKTQSRMLDETLARLYGKGIRNHRKFDALIEQMEELSLLAFQAAKMASNG